MIRTTRLILFLGCFCAADSASADEPSQVELDHFERRIRPLLVNQCVSCHGPKKQESGLRLDVRASAFAELDFGTAIVPGDPQASRLIKVIHYSDDDVQMPPKGKLTARQIRLLEAWVKSGAVWPKDSGSVANVDPDAWKKHWAFQPIARPAPPTIDADDWSATNVDRFVLRKLQAAALKPQAKAEPRTLMRRVFADLIGLPPTLDDVQKLATGDESFEATVDRLLASQHFGERWARHWMDVARYSDTTGYVFQEKRDLGDAWKYREWLINAFNGDMPIDDFLIHQIAADKVLAKGTDDELAATGYLTLGRRFLNNKHDIIDDRIDVVTRGMLGFTVTCARCHDHKFDPIPTADYYSLYGVFASTKEPDRKKTTVRLVDLPKPITPSIFKRGQAGNRGKRVPRQFLMALAADRKPFTDGSGRLELARAIASGENPLTARVFVNRVWGYLFGNFLVDTPSDFGVRTSPPSHPELLDYLAGSLIDNGWSIKTLLREMVLSSVYQQRSDAEPTAVDPENRLLARMNRKRLDFEAHRDALIAVSGELDLAIGGESVDITKAPFPKRRSVYAFIDRQNLPGVFRSFDLASPDTHAPQRYATTVPQQGLFQLNSPFVLEQAAALAKRTESIGDSKQRIMELFKLAYAREPAADEVAGSLEFLNSAAQPATADKLLPGWHYGYGSFDAKTNRVSFTRYPNFSDQTWRGGAQIPDEKLGWSLLHSKGGHPGEKGFAAIRRWVAPGGGRLSIRGVLDHKPTEGDGIVARIVSSRLGQVAKWKLAHQATPIVLPRVEVQTGDVIDFVCESGDTVFHDSFEWSAKLRLRTGDTVEWFDSVKQFSGTQSKPLDVWSQFAQVLLLANEFVFVD